MERARNTSRRFLCQEYSIRTVPYGKMERVALEPVRYVGVPGEKNRFSRTSRGSVNNKLGLSTGNEKATFPVSDRLMSRRESKRRSTLYAPVKCGLEIDGCSGLPYWDPGQPAFVSGAG